MAEWQPIETAPKDADEVIVLITFEDGTHGIAVMHWVHSERIWREWGDQSYDVKQSEITHWIPLPPFPP